MLKLETSSTLRKTWSRTELLVAFKLYCELPFGRMHSRNPEIVRSAEALGRTPSSLAMKLTNIASLDPAIRLTGRTGLTGASKADKAMWEEMTCNWDEFVVEAEKATFVIHHAWESEVNQDAPKTAMDDYSGVTRATTVWTRVRQGFFRKSVLSAYNYRCCISGVGLKSLLVASHIVPWSKDPKNRLNPQNGLCLSAIHDRAFDCGLITLSDDYRVQLSKTLLRSRNSFVEAGFFKYDGAYATLPEKFPPDQSFLDYHRTEIFLDARPA